MRLRKGISPFIATIILIVITLVIGGVLYSQFNQVIAAEVRNPSMTLMDVNVGTDQKTVTITVKNDGNTNLMVSKLIVSQASVFQSYLVGTNSTILSGSQSLKPGDLLTARLQLTLLTLPSFSPFTLTVVSDQLSRAFNVQA
jgi:flagellin-like protein